MILTNIIGRQVYDSRGRPTVACDILLDDKTWITSSVPSGASTGIHEAIELRDGGAPFGGRGVSRALEQIEKTIKPQLVGQSVDAMRVDQLLLQLDPSPNKQILGANTTLAVSQTMYRAQAYTSGVELYHLLASILDRKSVTFPTPMMNVINGGAHAHNRLSVQEYLLVPYGAHSFSQAVASCVEVTRQLGILLAKDGKELIIGDEGGYAPRFASSQEPFTFIMRAIEAAGFTDDFFGIALDVAATQFYNPVTGNYTIDAVEYDAQALIALYSKWAEQYPIIAIEDGCAEDDWEGWQALRYALGDESPIIGDDLTVTNVGRMYKAIQQEAANGVILKPNQIGTISQTLDAFLLAMHQGWTTVVSHRSGETEDTFIADLALGIGADFIKAGGPLRSERLAKYNRLLFLESQLTA
ncbi:phosphopyruvate hydratase [Candidatus Dependentiae bacterium]|nr:phosphopyruvate hydratase [Candidatus Dependentiae bacterium]